MEKRSEKSRKRYRTVAFRCSDSELLELEKRVELSGLQKQDYMLKSVLHQRIVVIGNELLFERLKDTLDEILVEVRRIDRARDLVRSKIIPLRTASEMLKGFEGF